MRALATVLSFCGCWVVASSFLDSTASFNTNVHIRRNKQNYYSSITRFSSTSKADIDDDDGMNSNDRSSQPPPTIGEDSFMKGDYVDMDELMSISSVNPWDDHVPQFNTVTLVGRAGGDPQARYFEDGKVVTNLSLAVQRKYHPLERKVKNVKYGEEATDWFALEIWGSNGEYAANYVKKGARIGVTGSLAMDTWIRKTDGSRATKTKIVVNHLDILESKAEAQLRQNNSSRQSSYQQGGRYNYGSGGNNNYYDDDGGPSSAGSGGFFDD